MLTLEEIQYAKALVFDLQASIDSLQKLLKQTQNSLNTIGLINEDTILDKEIEKIKKLQVECKHAILGIAGNVKEPQSLEDMKGIILTCTNLLPVIDEYKKAIMRFNSLCAENENLQSLLESYRVDADNIEWLAYSAEELSEKYHRYVDFMKLYDIVKAQKYDSDLLQRVLASFDGRLVMNMAIYSEKEVLDGESISSVVPDDLKEKRNEVEMTGALEEIIEQSITDKNEVESKEEITVDNQTDTVGVVKESIKEIPQAIWDESNRKLAELGMVLHLEGNEGTDYFTEKKYKRLLGKSGKRKLVQNDFVVNSMNFIKFFENCRVLLDSDLQKISEALHDSCKYIEFLISKGIVATAERNGEKLYVLSDKWYKSPDYEKLELLIHLGDDNKECKCTASSIATLCRGAVDNLFYGARKYLLANSWKDYAFNKTGNTLTAVYKKDNEFYLKQMIQGKVVYRIDKIVKDNSTLFIAQQTIPTKYIQEDVRLKVQKCKEEIFTENNNYVLVISLDNDTSFIHPYLKDMPDLKGYYHYNIITGKGISYDLEDFNIKKETDDFDELIFDYLKASGSEKNVISEEVESIDPIEQDNESVKLSNDVQESIEEENLDKTATVDVNEVTDKVECFEETDTVAKVTKDVEEDIHGNNEDINVSGINDVNAAIKSYNTEAGVNYATVLGRYRSAEDIKRHLEDMLYQNKLYCATAYMRAISLMDDTYVPLQKLLSYALRDPMDKYRYDAQTLISLVDVNHNLTDYLGIAGAFRVFFGSQVKYDYMLKPLYDMYSNNPILENYNKLKNLLFLLYQFKSKYNDGAHACAIATCREEDGIHHELRRFQQEATSTIKLRQNPINVTIPRLAETKQLIFSDQGDLCRGLAIVAKDHIHSEEAAIKKDKEEIETLLRIYFIPEGEEISLDNINQDRVKDFVEDAWIEAARNIRGSRNSSKIPKGLRSNLDNHVKEAVQLLVSWYCLVDTWDVAQSNKAKDAFIQNKEELVTAAREAREEILQATGDKTNRAGMTIICSVVDFILEEMLGEFDEFSYKGFYTPFLFNHYVTLAPKTAILEDCSFTNPTNHLDLDGWKEWVPDLRITTQGIEELYPFYRIEQHAKENLKSIEVRFAEIFENKEDDYGTANLLKEYAWFKNIDIGDMGKRPFEAHYANREAYSEKETFKGDIELAKAYGKLEEEIDKDQIMKRVEDLFVYCTYSDNYFIFKRYIDCLMQVIEQKGEALKASYIKELDSFKAQKEDLTEDANNYIRDIETMIENQNYTVAEDFLGSLKRGEKYINYKHGVCDAYLEDFLESYDTLYQKADREGALSRVLGIRDRNKDMRHAKELVSAWNFDTGVKQEKIKTIFTELGFPVTEVSEVKQVKTGAPEYPMYNVTLEDPKNYRQSMFMHPIAAFGSTAMKNGFHVVLLNRKLRAPEIMTAIQTVGQAKHTIFLLSFPMKLTDRKELARKIKEYGIEKVMAVIDRVLVTHLALNYKESTIQPMLMATMLPFSYVQPYVKDSSKVIPPEMFVGRSYELEQIQSPSGVNIVYGGRQLGKSALLRMAKNNIDYNESGDRAILVDIKNLNSRESARKISEVLSDEYFFKEEFITDDWRELARAIKLRLKDTEDRIGYFLLLLDEADAFIASESEDEFRAFDVLKDIGLQAGSDRFKFVVAGLRNIVMFKRKASLGNNSVINHLTSLTVRPLSYLDAKELLEKPLSYLGFRFPDNKQELQPMIFATANYFPGLIQLYCANLVSALTEDDYAGYSQTHTPPYMISENHIKKVLVNPEFVESIKDKFEITLRLDKDDYYFIIALMIAYRYKEGHDERGYTVADMLEWAKEYGVRKIAVLDKEKLHALMEEMAELNVLRSSKEGRYLFSRYRFMELMGSKEEIEEEISNYMEDGEWE